MKKERDELPCSRAAYRMRSLREDVRCRAAVPLSVWSIDRGCNGAYGSSRVGLLVEIHNMNVSQGSGPTLLSATASAEEIHNMNFLLTWVRPDPALSTTAWHKFII